MLVADKYIIKDDNVVVSKEDVARKAIVRKQNEVFKQRKRGLALLRRILCKSCIH